MFADSISMAQELRAAGTTAERQRVAERYAARRYA
jgi:hypothetical protein